MATSEIDQAVGLLRAFVAGGDELGEVSAEHAVAALDMIEREVAKLQAPQQLALEYPRNQLEHCEDSLTRQGQYMRDTFATIAEHVREAKYWAADASLGFSPNSVDPYLDAVLAIVEPQQEDGPTAEDLS